MTVTPICRSNCLSRPSAVRLLQDESCASRINDLLVVPEYPAAASTICNDKWWCRSFTVFFPSVCVSLAVITVKAKLGTLRFCVLPPQKCSSLLCGVVVLVVHVVLVILVVFVAFLGDLCYLWLCVRLKYFLPARVPWTSSKRNFLKNIPPSSFMFYIYCFSVVVHCRTVRQFRHRIYVRLPALIWSASSFVCHTVGTLVRPFPFAGLL